MGVMGMGRRYLMRGRFAVTKAMKALLKVVKGATRGLKLV
jgi:hypothetical protein